MRLFLHTYKYHLLLILVALIWIEAYNFLVQAGIQTEITLDASNYQESAKNLYIFHRGHNYRAILMALINGIPYVFGASDAFIFEFSDWVNLFCWLGSLLFFLEILNNFLKLKFAFLFAAAMVFFMGINALIFHLETECIYLFFIVAAFWFLMKYFNTKIFKHLAAGVSLIVLSMLIKPGSMLLGVLFTLFFIREIYRNYRSKFAWLIYGSYFLVMVQCTGVKYQFGNFTISYIDAVTYYDYLGARAEALDSGKAFKEVWKSRADYIYSLDMPEQKIVAAADFKKQLFSNTRHFFEAYFINLAENATTGSISISPNVNLKHTGYFDIFKALVFNISEWQNEIFSVLGILLSCYFLWKKRSIYNYEAMMGIFILYILFLSGVSCSEGDRFNVITFPFAVVLLAKFISEKRASVSKN
ncbi:MAG TPA: hypothetical protein VK528_03440 [Flavobacterium sp.]|nr:hypothetical protein [Flavobacterium sp.]